ncbi:sucrase-isomaltase, intestinal-like [Diadema setosum]|uniref:sucrase-isomaltase, intestinal-like n=1 Tax=Diadema setosum TaxID=31175 RepID=UPI003B3B68F3
MSRVLQAIVAIVVFMVVGIIILVPSIVVTLQPYSNWRFNPVTCGDIPENDRINCFPDVEIPTRRQCMLRGCCYQRITWDRLNRIPECYLPLGVGYRVLGREQEVAEGFQLDLMRLKTPRFFYEQIDNLRFRAEYYKENILHMKMYEYRYVHRTEVKYLEAIDRRWKPRYEVPIEYPKTLLKNAFAEYEIEYQRNPFTFRIMRRSTNSPILDTNIGGLIYEDQFIQLSARLPNSVVYGLGEHMHWRFRHEVNWHIWGIFAADNDPDATYKNLYGHHPFFMGVDDGGRAFGVLLVNSNAQDVMLTPASAVTWRTTGGILDFWVFTGPSPEEVIQQYTEIVGRPVIPPFWALGMQIGRADWQSVAEMQEVVDRNVAAGIPLDAIYSDVNYMKDFKTFTYDTVNFEGLPDFVRGLNAGGMKYIISLNSGVTNQVPEPINNYHFYYYGHKYGYFINETDRKTPASGFQWPGEVSFADFTNPQTRDWWAYFGSEFSKELPFDGVVMTMNEPGNMVNGSHKGCGNRKWNFPPWVPELHSRMLYYRTICMDYEQHLGLHYNVHSLNGHFSAEAGQHLMEQVKPNQRSVVLSRSTFSGTGRFAGHALGNQKATWGAMYNSLVATLEFNLFGIPYVGPNTCGYYDNADDELCIRWTQMSAFFPIFRFYKARGTEHADPAALGADFINNVRSAIDTRYQLLPYIYTQFYHARLDGFTVVRSVVSEFPSFEKNVWDVDWEFFLGPAVLVSPVLDEGDTSVNIYIPHDRFYNFYTGEQIATSLKDSNTTLPAPLDTIPVLIRGGYIVPLQLGTANSTQYSRLNPLELRIAIPEELQEQAYGDLFWDDGSAWNSYERQVDLYLEFFADQNRIDILSQRVGMVEADPNLIPDLPVIQRITMYGLTNNPGSTVAVNNVALPTSQFRYTSSNTIEQDVFEIWDLSLDIISDHVIELGATANPFGGVGGGS